MGPLTSSNDPAQPAGKVRPEVQWTQERLRADLVEYRWNLQNCVEAMNIVLPLDRNAQPHVGIPDPRNGFVKEFNSLETGYEAVIPPEAGKKSKTSA